MQHINALLTTDELYRRLELYHELNDIVAYELVSRELDKREYFKLMADGHHWSDIPETRKMWYH